MGRPETAAIRLLSGEREPVRVATTGNITLEGLQTIDGVTLETGDRVLVRSQTDATENGIYTASTGRWYRASDARSPRSINKGVTVIAQEGTLGSGVTYQFKTLDPDIGDDDITVDYYLSDTLNSIDAESIDAAAKTAMEFAALAGEAFAALQNELSVGAPPTVTSLTDMADQPAVLGSVYLRYGDYRDGWFDWHADALTSSVTADPNRGVFVPPATDLTGASGCWVRRHGGVLNPFWFGAAGDGETDDTGAFNAMTALIRADVFSVGEAGWATTQVHMKIPPMRYYFEGSVNFTELREYAMIVEANGAEFLAHCGNKVLFDLIDTRFIIWEGGTIIGSGTDGEVPQAAMIIGRRDSDNRVADTISIAHLVCTGHYSKASFVNFQAETVYLEFCKFVNFRPTFSSACFVLDALNETGITSDFITPSDTPISANGVTCQVCEFKTFDSDGTTRGAGYPVRIITSYTDGAAWRDISFHDYYANSIADPDAVQHTDYNTAVFYVKGYVHNLTITGRSERFGYIDSILRIENSGASNARIKGLTMREHYMAGKSGLIQGTSNTQPILIYQGDLSATVSQEAMLASPAAAPAGTIFGSRSADGTTADIYFSGVVKVPADTLQGYRLNDFSGCFNFDGVIYTDAPWPNIVVPQSGNYSIYSNARVQHGGAHIFGDAANPLSITTILGHLGMSPVTRATLPTPSTQGWGFRVVTDPAAGKSNLVTSDTTKWVYTDGTTVAGAPTG